MTTTARLTFAAATTIGFVPGPYASEGTAAAEVVVDVADPTVGPDVGAAMRAAADGAATRTVVLGRLEVTTRAVPVDARPEESRATANRRPTLRPLVVRLGWARGLGVAAPRATRTEGSSTVASMGRLAGELSIAPA